MKMFDDLLKTATSTGQQLLQNEIARHGGSQPTERPDPQTVPAQAPATPGTEAKKTMDKKTMYLIGGGIAAALVLVLVLKK